MDDPYLVMVSAAASVYAVIFWGGLMRSLGWLTEEADQSL
jgi:hypothetical protein